MRKTSFFFPATRLRCRLESRGYHVEGPEMSVGNIEFMGIYDKDGRRVARASREGTFGELSVGGFKYGDRPDIREAAKGLAIVY